MLKCAGEGALFSRACRQPAETQADVLRQILRANRDTWFGRNYAFAKISNPREFQKHVPSATYDDFAPLVTRIAGGEDNVLTRDRVFLLEPTSGTTGGEKWIPYTAGLRRQFQRGIAAWIADLFFHRPAVRAGRAYWSISPAFGPTRRTSGGLPLGFDDDAAYLGGLEQFALRKLLVVPGNVSRLRDLQRFRDATLGYLLAAEDLTLISVWSPTFLSALLSPLSEPESQARTVERSLACVARAALGQSHRLQKIWRTSASFSTKLRQTWPRLALISCWTDAAAGQFLPELQRFFPDVEIQPKGLLATEGFVSFPIVGQEGAALALRCHFFEFEEVSGGSIRLADELERGGRYTVLVTTAGGLYRYQLRDEIEVVGFHHHCPLLRFQGKRDLVSDLVGEKLAEGHVRTVLARLRLQASTARPFQLLVPVLGQPPHYRLYLQGFVSTSECQCFVESVRTELQMGLLENSYYRHAIAMGQLAPVEVVLLDVKKGPAWAVYERQALERGQKCGAIKPRALDRCTGWPERFAPLVLVPTNADRPEHGLPSRAPSQ
jgi:hypothetical protein